MGWRKDRQPKQSITSVTSMSFLTDQNLSFHRFSDGTISSEGKKNGLNEKNKPQIWTTNTEFDYSTTNPTLLANESATSTTKILPSVDESTDSDAVSKRYSSYSVCNSTTTSTVGNNTLKNGSTMKLIQVQKDDSDTSNKQSRCSIFRGTILCLCMNLTYANIVRFPRELERHGVAFLVPYLTLMFFIGVPIVLLEIALGQFLGQGSAHIWKASPFFKGASIIGRIGAWLTCIWISMQMSLALLYMGQMSFSSVPFRQCPSTVQQNPSQTHYEEVPTLGQRCLQKTFLRTVSESSLNFGLLAIGLVFLWVIVMMCTHSSRVNRRSLLMFGIAALGLLLFQTGWQVSNTIEDGFFPQTWPFNVEVLTQASTWFYALIQVIYSTQIGIGAIPVMTGKFLYKGDAIRTCTIYMCFNFLITIIATAYYMTTFGQHNISIHEMPFPDLSTLTSIYDRAFVEPEKTYLRSLIPSLAYLMVIFAGIISISIAIYTSSRLLKRHPNYILCLIGMFTSIAFLLCPNFTVSRLIDMRYAGIIIICALIFDIACITLVYGTKDLAVDLEFSIGRPIMKFWLFIWTCVPLFLLAILTSFIVFPTNDKITEPIVDIIPKWIPIILCLIVIIVFAIHATTKQVDYNTFDMIHEATRCAKDWGPADPLVRHAWKQWKTVCDDTGQRDFTLRRRGTKDWTSSIKKGQYSHASRVNQVNKYNANGKQTVPSTGGSNSPNYSGSVFGDSAIEEDISCDKYSPNQMDGSRRSSTNRINRQQSNSSGRMYHQQSSNDENDVNYQKIPIRISNGKRYNDENFTSRIEISDIPPPPAQFQAQSTFIGTTKNPLCHLQDVSTAFSDKYGHHPFHQEFMINHQIYNHHHHPQQQQQQRGNLINNIHIQDFSDGSGSLSTKTTNTNGTHEPYIWRKMTRNGDEFSTEL